MHKIYLASLYSRRAELEDYAKILTEAGHTIVSTWVYGNEVGLNRTDIALLDIYDVERADMVLSFTEPYGTMYKGGGRCVEFGYGLARGKVAAIIGERENVFHHHPSVIKFETLDEFIRHYQTQVE